MPSERGLPLPLGHQFREGLVGVARGMCHCGQPRSAHEPPAEPQPKEAFRELAVVVGEDVAHLTEADIDAVRKFGPAQPHPAPDPEDRLAPEALTLYRTVKELLAGGHEAAAQVRIHAALVRVVAEEREAITQKLKELINPRIPEWISAGAAFYAIRQRGLKE